MGRSTLGRDYDVGRMLADYEARITVLERQMLLQPTAATIWQNVDGGFDTGWQDIVSFDALFTPQGGVNTPRIRRFGPVVMVTGRATTTAAIAGNSNVYTVPSGFSFEPPAIAELGRSLEAGASGFDHRFFMGVTGVAAQQGLSVGNGASVSLSVLYAVFAPF